MTNSDSSDFTSVREFQHEAETPREVSNSESGGAEEESFRERPGFQSCNQYRRGELQLTPCDWWQLLVIEQRVEDRYDFVESTFVSRVGMAEVVITLALVASFER